MGKTLNSFIFIEPIVEEKTTNGLMVPGASAEKIRAKKGKVVRANESEGIPMGSTVLYDDARSFLLVDKEFETTITVIRRGDIIYII